MSPVTTYVSGLPSYLPGQTVVSSVFGKQLSKMVAQPRVRYALLDARNQRLHGFAAEMPIGLRRP